MENSECLRLKDIVEKLADVKVLVVGDLMLDRYWWGDVTRISPEAPVPVVRLRKDTYAAGGAANVAANVAGLGAAAYLVGTIGADLEGELFTGLIENLWISTEHLIKTVDRRTTVKTRIIAHSQQVVRVDREETGPLAESTENALWEQVSRLLPEVDVVIVSDYAKGTLTEGLVARLITEAKELSKPVLIDPKGKDYSKYRGASLMTPNRREAAEACHLESETQNLVEVAGKSLLLELALNAVLITQGEDGMTLFCEDTAPLHLEAMAQEIFDVTGAGDTVIACIGAALGAGADYREAAVMANLGASLVIQHVGTTFVSAERLIKAIESSGCTDA
jgi:rfaE bifunctional protein kinase chain/domain